MIEIITNKPSITFNLDNTINATFKFHKSALPDIETIKTEQIYLTIKEYRKKRSLSQNAYMWVLLNKLAEKLHDTSENIYKHFIRDYGVRDYILVQDKAVEELRNRWEKKGIGWFAEVMSKSKTVDGTTVMIVYYGSSSYDSKEMSRVVDAVVESCQENEISTMTITEIMSLQNEND